MKIHQRLHRGVSSFSDTDILCANPLVDGVTLTTNPENMWRCEWPSAACFGSSLERSQELLLRFELPEKLTLRGLRIWNYNAGGREVS